MESGGWFGGYFGEDAVEVILPAACKDSAKVLHGIIRELENIPGIGAKLNEAHTRSNPDSHFLISSSASLAMMNFTSLA